MEVEGISVDTFWRGEKTVRGTVLEGMDTYEVALHVKGSQIYDYSCSCSEGNSHKGMCRHAICLWDQGEKLVARETLPSASTSQEVRTMIREYTNRQVARMAVEDKLGEICLIPRIVADRRSVRVEFFIKKGNNRKPLADLGAFARNMGAGALASYGRNLSFYHVYSAFEPESRPLAAFLVETAGSYEEYYRQLHRSSFASPVLLKNLPLTKYHADSFFRLLLHRKVEIQDYTGRFGESEIREDYPGLKVKVEREGRDGIRLSVPGDVYPLFGEQYLYIVDGNSIYRCGLECAHSLGIFLEQAAAAGRHVSPGDAGRGAGVVVHERDIPLFLERVMESMEPFVIWQKQDLDLEVFRPEPLKACFYFDSHHLHEIRLRPVLSYGEIEFHPMEDEHLPRSLCRDVPGEFRIGQLIARFFRYREPDGGDLVIQGDDDGIYQLLTQGIPQFLALGEVYRSETVCQMEILSPPRLSIGVSVSQDWLDLTVDTGDLSGDELVKILAAYEVKQKYYRLKQGQFLTLDADQGLYALSQAVKQMGIDARQMKDKTIHLPKYRAYYLDQLVKDSGEIRFYRDQLFKIMIRQMKGVEDAEYEIPESLRTVLRGYQKTGFRWMKTLDEQGFGGILADDMGLGKTLQAIALLLDESYAQADSLSLIVCPASLVYNWEQEIQRFAPGLAVMTVAGSAKEREEKIGRLLEGGYHVAITSYDLLKRDSKAYHALRFRYQIIDEAQYIKNASTQTAKAVKSIYAQTRFALTGTPVENRLGELWSIFDYLMPGFLFSYAKFKRNYELPILRQAGQGGQEHAAMRGLRHLTGPFILRRLKEQVLKELPGKLEQVVYTQMQGKQKELYTAYAWELKQDLESHDISESDKLQILTKLTRLRQICCDPALCLESYKEGSAKLETCLELILSGVGAGRKILLFSQFTSMLERIRRRLEKEGVESYLLTGSTSKENRLKQVSAFQRDTVPVFLISLKAGGTGLNLTAADMVIHYDPWWNVAVQNQATDRTHRIGQSKQVNVYKLIARDTIEENILKLQDQKRQLADQIIAEGTVSLSSLSMKDLAELL